MELLTIMTMLALVQLAVFGGLAGYARGKYNVPAPAVTGNEMFERHYRVHYNTIEMLVMFIPGLWAFGFFIGQYWAAGLGAIFLVGRALYAWSYVRDPARRGPGMLASIFPCWILVTGGLIGALMSYAST